MKNKCPNCGFEYGEFDIFCARCGQKIVKEEKIEIPVPKIEKSEKALEVFKIPPKDVIASKKEFFFSDSKKVFDSAILNFVVFLIIISLILTVVMYFILNRHEKNKLELQYKNLISNPAQIPLLKEPSDYNELASNIKNVEKFLSLYLKYSDDTKEKKEQVFASYLNELDKLPHITNDAIGHDNFKECDNIDSARKAKKCAISLNNKFKGSAIHAYAEPGVIYLYPNSDFINKTYSKFLNGQFKGYIALRAKYNIPTAIGINLYIKPKELAKKIADYEKMLIKSDNSYVSDSLEEALYIDFRKFIFTPSIYATTTQEMRKEFKCAYNYYIRTKKHSSLRPVVMSYMDKKRSYNEENFKNDYPYKLFELNFDENVANSTFSDVFVQLRKNIFTQNSDLGLTYVYSALNGKWTKYEPNTPLIEGEYVISDVDENNNISIYNYAFSPLQELNILKYARVYLINGGLYVYNRDKLSISKINFNGKIFSIYNMSQSDITSLFPGIEVINIDSYSNYNIFLEKDNIKKNYIILSKYSQGWYEYGLNAVKGEIHTLILPNMFSVNSNKDVVVSFDTQNDSEEVISQNSPAYKFTIHTLGQSNSGDNEDEYVNYDEKTAQDEAEESNSYKPNIMPKIPNANNESENETKELMNPPEQNIEPPSDIEE